MNRLPPGWEGFSDAERLYGGAAERKERASGSFGKWAVRALLLAAGAAVYLILVYGGFQ